MKTFKEIKGASKDLKAALACPVYERGHHLECSKCAYHGKGLLPCRKAVHGDALIYIGRLEARLDRCEELLKLMGVTVPEE